MVRGFAGRKLSVLSKGDRKDETQFGSFVAVISCACCDGSGVSRPGIVRRWAKHQFINDYGSGARLDKELSM
jgi:hypothetical protein